MIFYTDEKGGEIKPLRFTTKRQIIIRQLKRNRRADYEGGFVSHIKDPHDYITKVVETIFSRNGKITGIWDANIGDYQRVNGKRVRFYLPNIWTIILRDESAHKMISDMLTMRHLNYGRDWMELLAFWAREGDLEKGDVEYTWKIAKPEDYIEPQWEWREMNTPVFKKPNEDEIGNSNTSQ